MKKFILPLILVWVVTISNAQQSDEYLEGRKQLKSGTILTTLGVSFLVLISNLPDLKGSTFPAVGVGAILIGFGILYISSGIIDMIKHRKGKSTAFYLRPTDSGIGLVYEF